MTLRKIKEAKKLNSKEVKATKWVKEKEYSFGIKKNQRDLSLVDVWRQIKLICNHTITAADEIKEKQYYKLYDSRKYDINNYIVFSNKIQKALGCQRIYFMDKKMNVDDVSFLKVTIIMATCKLVGFF